MVITQPQSIVVQKHFTVTIIKLLNVRSVSELVVLSTEYERVMTNQLLAYFENNFPSLLAAYISNKIWLPLYAVKYGSTI